MTSRAVPGKPVVYRFLSLLLVAGIALTVGDILLGLWLAFGESPAWLWSMLSLAPWGPICLVLWAILWRRQRWVQSMHASGARGQAAIESIATTSSVINGRPVLRLALSISLPAQPSYSTSIRTAPPSHLVGTLRPGVDLPALIDPRKPSRVLVDWARLEAETSPVKDHA